MLKTINILFILCLCLSICLVGCTNSTRTDVVTEPSENTEQNNNIDKAIFEAQVLEIYEKSIMVKPSEGTAEAKNSDKITVGISGINIDFDIAIGEEIRITYDGIILESYPAQIHMVYSIEKVNNESSANNDAADLDHKQEEWGATLSVKNVTASGLTIVCEQSGGDNVSELNTGSYYVIQKRTETGFVNVEYLPHEYDIGWTMEAWIIPLNSTTTWDVNWEWLYGKLEPGEYRIGKEISNFKGPGDFDQEIIYAHFIVENNLNSI